MTAAAISEPGPDPPDVSVVVPVYCSERTLPTLVDRISRVLQTVSPAWEIVLVDDGSRDASWEAIVELRRQYGPRLVAVQLMRNFGQHNALMCGLRHARGRLIVTLDDDLQNPPEEIPKLIAAIDAQQLDLVYGVPDLKSHGAWRNAGSRLVNRFYRMVFRTPVTLTSFRVIREPLKRSILSYNLNFTFLDGLLAWNSTRIGQITVAHHPRSDGKSHYSLTKLVTLALNLFTNFSLLPLQLMSMVGIVCAVSGLLAALYYLLQYFTNHISVPGYASSIIAILVLGGLQMLATGIIGEYIGRVHLNINRKPQYTERELLADVSPPEDAATGEVPAHTKISADSDIEPHGNARERSAARP